MSAASAHRGAVRPAPASRPANEWAARWDGGWAAGSWADWSVTTPTPAAATPAAATPAAATPLQIPVTVFAINEPTPGPRWKALFDATWPAYRAWYLGGSNEDAGFDGPAGHAGSDGTVDLGNASPGHLARPDLATATAMLARYMPELVPTYERLVELVGGDEAAARMLTLWNAPAFLPACSQAVLTGPSPTLCRNYDYSPDLWEQTIYTSAFTGRKVIGTGDCLWGLLDGMNDAGLAVSLTFGGRPGSGPGFAIPLVVRYLLEVAGTADEARQLLRGLPIAMSYNITVVDRAGDSFTAFVAPGQEVEFTYAPVATNHHGASPEYPARATSLRSVPRLDALNVLVAGQPTPDELAVAFQRDPLYNREYSRAFGTLYTAVYRIDEGIVEYRWPEVTWRRGFGDDDDTREVTLTGV